MNEAKQATPHSELIEQLMDSRVPKTEREHAARREIEMLREALRLPAALDTPEREPELEPVMVMDAPLMLNGQPLYTRPQREWQGLTDENIKSIWHDIDGEGGMLLRFARAIEAKLKEKNT